jgi:hypothetical protein
MNTNRMPTTQDRSRYARSRLESFDDLWRFAVYHVSHDSIKGLLSMQRFLIDELKGEDF